MQTLKQALVSIHDVMPDTLDRVASLLELIPTPVRLHTVLLVVPGRAWSAADIHRLAAWQAEGLELAGHGWSHRAGRICTAYHWLHSLCLSRQAAEHLSQPRQALQALLEKNYRWFGQQGLASPILYVPPAWALGRLSAEDLRRSPFQYIETTGGYRHLASGARCRTPLMGYEADTRWRAVSLGLWNRVNQAVATPARPVRLALHPYDNELRLSRELRKALSGLEVGLDYRTLFSVPEFTRS